MSTKPKLPELPEFHGWIGANDIDPDAGVEGFTSDQLRDYALQAVKDERERCAAQIPTTWLDPLLTGPRGMGQPPFSCQDIERLLKRLASAIRSLPDPD